MALKEGLEDRLEEALVEPEEEELELTVRVTEPVRDGDGEVLELLDREAVELGVMERETDCVPVTDGEELSLGVEDGVGAETRIVNVPVAFAVESETM